MDKLKSILLKRIDTKLFAGIVIFVLAFSVMGVSVVEARVNNADTVVALSQQNDNVTSRLTLPAIAAATSTILVDLSNNINYRHIGTQSLEISQIRVQWTTDVIATTTLKVGVISSTSASGALADVVWFDEVSFSTVGGGNAFLGRQEKVLDYNNSVIKLAISSASTTGFISNDKSNSDSTFATTTKLSSSIGLTSAGSGTFPGVGDLVMRIYDQKGTATTSVTTIYRTKLQP